MADEFDPDKITNLSQVREQRDLEEKYVDFMSSLREKVGKRKKLGDAHSWKYEIGDRVVTRHTAKLPNPTPWKITERVIREKGLLEGSRPREGKNITGRDVPYYMVSRIEDVGTPEEGEVFSSLPEWSIQSKFGLEGLVPDEPRPKDQPRLPPLLEGPPEEPGKKPSKGRVMRGIGSLMRGRNVFSLIQALREGYELLPEEYQVLDEALQYLKGTQFSIDKPGIESLKEWLGISPEDLGETIPLPKVQKIDTALEDISVDPVQGTAPEKTVKAYKLFRTDSRFPGELFPLFVESKSPINIGSWVDSALVEQTTAGKIKSKLGPLAFRPGWHGSEFPVATHIGSKSSPLLNKPDIRPDNQVWAEVEFPNDVDWQTEAINRASIVKSGPRKGEINLREAHITDQIPTGGFYRYKTNPNMQNDWLISGSMKINRVLNDADVERINSAAGLADLPRARFVHKTRPDTEKAAGGFIDKPLYDDQRMIG
jgi:hypothetical protein